jgi:hypothetical protein
LQEASGDEAFDKGMRAGKESGQGRKAGREGKRAGVMIQKVGGDDDLPSS